VLVEGRTKPKSEFRIRNNSESQNQELRPCFLVRTADSDRFGFSALGFRVLQQPLAVQSSQQPWPASPRRNRIVSPKFPRDGKHSPSFSAMNEQIVILDSVLSTASDCAAHSRGAAFTRTILRYDTPAKEIAALKPSESSCPAAPPAFMRRKRRCRTKAFSRLMCPSSVSATACNCWTNFLGGKVERGDKREFAKVC